MTVINPGGSSSGPVDPSAAITPGNPGDVLTTNVGTGVVDWEPASGGSDGTLIAGSVNADGSLESNTVPLTVTRVSTGIYTITLDTPLPGAGALLFPMAAGNGNFFIFLLNYDPDPSTWTVTIVTAPPIGDPVDADFLFMVSAIV